MDAQKKTDSPLVLVVDDEPVMRVLARESLQQFGFEVIEAENGEEALSVFDELRPDLLLLDVKMPVMNGFETCKCLRASAAGRFTPVLMMTGLDDISAIEQAYETGATDFINKPINWVILGHRVEYMLRASRFAEELRDSQTKLANAQRIASLGYWELDFATEELTYSNEICEIFGVTREELGNRIDSLLDRVHADDRIAVDEFRRILGERRDGGELEYRIVKPQGGVSCVRQQVEFVRDENGNVVSGTGTLQDISERRDAEEKIRLLAHYDSLTGLPNRELFLERLDIALATAKRHERMTAILFLDLDRFKRINETLGHSAGDLLLSEVAARLVRCVRSTDVLSRASAGEPAQLVSRFGGDEFVVMLSELTRIEDAATVARRMVVALKESFSIAGQEVFAGASIGIAINPYDGDSVEALVKNADTAMSFAKSEGTDSYRYYTQSMNAKALERLALETSLRGALERDEFELHYQPQLDLASGRVLGAEALVRWNHPEEGLLLPGAFITLAEESGLILPVGDWVLEEGCRQAKEWHDAGHTSLRVAINLSSRQFDRWSFPGTVAEVLERTGVEPGLVDLELTESALMKEEETTKALGALKEYGIRVSIDDFGTGYSSLAYLMRLPLDALKIDRCFLEGVPYDTDQAALVDAIMAMARSLKLDVIAEGIENEAQLSFLRKRGCRNGQGFLFSKALPANEFLEYLKRSENETSPSVRSLAG
ncbi:MAG: EAL domain-containing protein [Acidobacteriota bacterium]|nr:EAL domain-containing protein [Acidobacteriota bacterium]